MDKRILWLSDKMPSSPKSVVYLMSRDQRVQDNHALLCAQAEALEHNLPLVVCFNFLPRVGVRAREHYQFMVDGLRNVEVALNTLNIPFCMTTGNMADTLLESCKQLQPRTVYFDLNPMHGPRNSQKEFAKRVHCRVAVVDTHNIVPVWQLSDKQEFAAHTIRRKLHKALGDWLEQPTKITPHPHTIESIPKTASWNDVGRVVNSISPCGIVNDFESGEEAAERCLREFIQSGLGEYADNRNDPTKDAQSNLSPYLHFGQLSALRVVLDVLDSTKHVPLLMREPKMPSASGTPTRDDGIDAFIEEMVVRRELSDNFCFYQPYYDSLEGAPDWAKDSLEKHASDPREFIYTTKQFEEAKTHDDAWNAAQKQLRKTGKIHGYMRMYWAKKILEWSATPQEAVATALYLNDHYSIDGGDPNGYVGVLWSIAGLHDRPWFERDIYGKIRYMNENGLKNKFDLRTYIDTWN